MRRTFYFVLLIFSATLVVAITATSSSLPAQTKPKYNVLLIASDDLRPTLGCYGNKIVKTPNIDKLALSGMKFTRAYSGCTVCAPARSTLMTGTHLGHSTVRTNPGGVSLLAEDITIAQVLKKAGYVCGGFGKWGLGDLDTPGVPERHGFDKFYGYYHQVHAHYFFPEYLIDTGKRAPLTGNDGFYSNNPQSGAFPLALQPQKWTVLLAVGSNLMGARPVPRCEPSQKGWLALRPQAHQK